MTRRRPPERGARAQGVLDLQRRPIWMGGGFRLRKASLHSGRLPLWARFGLHVDWTPETILTLLAIASAAIGAAALVMLVLSPTSAR